MNQEEAKLYVKQTIKEGNAKKIALVMKRYLQAYPRVKTEPMHYDPPYKPSPTPPGKTA